MITSIHTLIYSDDANATRAFLRDVLGWKYVAEDFDNDWLIFKSGPSEMGVHPTHGDVGRPNLRFSASPLNCPHVRQHRGNGRRITRERSAVRGPVEQREYGRVIMMAVPGADDIQLYEPTHKLAYNF